jgi:hypothetical protein
MSAARYFIFGLIGLIGLVGIATFIYEVLPASRQKFGKPVGRGGVDSCFSLLGILSCLTGIGLVVYDRHSYGILGSVLAGVGFIVLCLVIFLRSQNYL